MSTDNITGDIVVEAQPSTSTEDTVNKRTIAETSFDQTSSPVLPKRSHTEGLFDSDIECDAPVTQGILVSTLESFFNRFECTFNLKFENINSRLDTIDQRLISLEEDAASRDTRINNALGRVDDLEQVTGELEQRLARVEAAESGIPSNSWQPVGTPDTNILMLGDSNSGGKIKFGDGMGTLGRALPGTCNYCPKFEDLPSFDSPILQDVSEVVLSVGVNNLKVNTCDPGDLVIRMNTYVKSLINNHPGLHVFLPGVLPVHSAFSDQAMNSKIRLYNHFLRDMCCNMIRTTYIDVNVFSAPDNSLKPNLSNGATDPLHLNGQGIKLFASRLKYSLRAHHGLPSAPRRPRPTPASIPGGSAPSGREQSVMRGGHGRGSYTYSVRHSHGSRGRGN